MLTADYADERGPVNHADWDEATKLMGKKPEIYQAFAATTKPCAFKTTRNQSSLDGRDPSLRSA